VRIPRFDLRSLAVGVLAGAGLTAGLRVLAQPAAPAPAPASPPAFRYQIASAGAPNKLFVLDAQTSTVYVLNSTAPEVWEATPGFFIPDPIKLLEARKQPGRGVP
jgi:hypothetical protein